MGSKFEADNNGNVTILKDLTVDTNVLKVDSNLNRVGINKSAPDVALDVVGSATITGTATLGTIAGVLHGTAGVVSASNVLLGSEVSGTLPVANGGTGNTAYTQYGIVYAPTTGSIGQLALGTTTQVLHGNATGAASFGQVSLTADVTGTLPIGNGGTNATVIASGLVRSNGSALVGAASVSLSAEVSGTLPLSNGGTGFNTIAADRFLYTSALDTFSAGTITAAGRAILDDATATDQRTTLGLGTMATQSASSVAITGGTFVFASPGSDHTYSGITVSGTSGEALAIGDICYLKSDGRYYKADADSSTTMPGTILCTETVGTFPTAFTGLSYGIFRDDSWTWTIGGILYASLTSGAMVQSTAGFASGDQVQIVGHALSATTVLFNPNLMLIEIA